MEEAPRDRGIGHVRLECDMQRDVEDRTFRSQSMEALLASEGRLVVLIATAGEDGLPHLTTADRILPQPEGLVEVSGWLCATTIRNLKQNSRLALAVRAGHGSVQIEGRADDIQEDVTLDGYLPEETGQSSSPQVRWILHVHPQRFFRFTDGLHSDEPLGAASEGTASRDAAD